MTGPIADPYSRRFEDLLLEYGRRISKLEGGQRATQLGNSSIEDDFVAAYDALGQARQLIGRQSDGTFSITYGNGDAPPVPDGVNVAAGQLSLIIQWDGTFVGNADRPKDFVRLDIHVSESSGFTPSGETIRASLFGEGATTFFADSDTKYVKVVAVNNSDVPSSATEEVAILPLPADQIAVGAIGASQLAALIVLANRIVAGDPSGTRVELNGDGFIAVNGDGVETISLDSDTGNAIFRGTIRTDDNGLRRIVINDDVAEASTIRFFAPGEDVDHAALFQVGDDKTFTVCGFQSVDDRGELIFDNRTILGTDGFAMLRYGTPQGWLGGSKSLFYVDLNQANVQAPTVELFATKQYPGDATFGAGTRIVFAIKDASGNMISTSRIYFEDRSTEPWIRFPSQNISIISGVASRLYIRDATTGGTPKPISASAFTVESARARKKDIRSLPFDPVTALENAPISMWKYSGSEEDHIGPMIEDLPPQLQIHDEAEDVKLLDLGSMGAVTMAAVQKLIKKVKDLEARVGELENGRSA